MRQMRWQAKLLRMTRHIQGTGVSRRHFVACASLASAKLLVAALAPFFASTVAQAAQPAVVSQRLAIAVADRHSMLHLPLTVAHELGFFKAEGLHVELIDMDSETRAIQSVFRGVAGLAVCSFSSIASQQSRGMDMRSVLLQMRCPQVALGVSPKSFSHYKTAADLKGRRVGVLGQSAMGKTVLGMALAQSGLKLSDVQLVTAEDPADLLQRYRSGQLDALSAQDPLLTQLEHRSELRVVVDTRTLRGTRELFGGPMPGAALCAPPDFIKQHAPSCQALAHGLVRALKWLQTAGPSDIIKTLPEAHFEGDRAMYLASFERAREGFSVDGVISADAMVTAFNVQAQLDRELRPERFEMGRSFTNEFALKAKVRYRV